MEVKVITKLQKNLQPATYDDLRDLLVSAGLLGAEIIKERTAAGKDFRGEVFHEYSDKYAAYRAMLNLPTDHVDLFLRGTMMAAIQVKAASKKSVKIGFASKEEAKKAVSHHNKRKVMKKKAGKVQEIYYKREFFAFSEKEETRIITFFKKLLVQHIMQKGGSGA